MLAGPGWNGENAPVEPSPTEVLDPPSAGAVGTEVTDEGATPRSDTWLRVACHLAAELPLVVFGIVEMGRGWRPVSDNADLALRSYQVFTSRTPLVGHQMAVSVGPHAVFGPGPLQSWILAVPVRIDPAQGALWGAMLAAIIAIAMAIEATWSVAGWRGATATAGCVLLLVVVRPEVVLDPVWNVWFALLFLVATFCTALAVATGRWGWWPLTVVAASVVVQCQAAYAPPAVALCLVAPALGLLARRDPQGTRFRWLAAGLVAGVALWAAPIIQEITTSPGNLTLLVRAAGSGPTIGTTAALRALGGATRLPPAWVHALPTGGGLAQFFGVAGLVDGPEWWGFVVLGLLVLIGAMAAWTARRGLAVLSVLTLVLVVGGVVTVASIPSSQFLVLGYLGALLAPVGLAVWVTFLRAAGETVLAGVRRIRGGSGRSDSTRLVSSIRWPVAIALVSLSIWATVVGLGQVDGTAPTLSGWPAVRATDRASAAVARIAPRNAFRLRVDGPPDGFTFAVESGVAYELATRGLDPRPTTAIGFPTFGRPPAHGPTVVVTLGGPDRPVGVRLQPGP